MTDLPLRRHDTADCPFELCDARVEIAHEMRAPGPTAGPHVNRVKIHSIESRSMPWADGQPCPASLMVLPLNDAAIAALDEYKAIMINSAANRTQDEIDTERRHRGETPRHSREPRPDENPKWFRANPGSSSRHHPPLRGFPNVNNER